MPAYNICYYTNSEDSSEPESEGMTEDITAVSVFSPGSPEDTRTVNIHSVQRRGSWSSIG